MTTLFLLVFTCFIPIIIIVLCKDEFKEYKLFIRRLIIELDDRGYAPKTIWNILTVYESDFWESKAQIHSEDIEFLLPP